jgi:hypothetical protein
MGCGCENNKSSNLIGGMVSSPAAFPQGASWNVETALPGMDGNVADAGNFYKVNPESGELPDPVSSNNTQRGGRHRKSKKSRRRKRKSKKSRQPKSSRKACKGRKVRRRKTMKGGSSRDNIFQGLINGYRGTMFRAGDLVNQWSGKSGQLSPAPTDQAPVPNGNVMIGEMPDVNSINSAADQAVTNI